LHSPFCDVIDTPIALSRNNSIHFPHFLPSILQTPNFNTCHHS
jgi:hypothetical protein